MVTVKLALYPAVMDRRVGALPISTPLFVRHMGEAGPVILLLHGLGASGRSWRLVAERLAGTHRIVCPDLLGFGRSPRPHAAYTVAGHLTRLEATLDPLDAGHAPVLLPGHSTGAVLALERAAAQPERFRGVALISLPAYRSADQARACIAGLSPLAWATVARPDLGELICGVICAGRPLWRALMPLLMPRVPAGIARDMVLHNWVSYSGTLTNVLVDHRVAPAAARLAATGLPAALRHGQRDQVAPRAAAEELAGRYAWPVQILTGQTHSLLVDAPRPCAGVLAAL